MRQRLSQSPGTLEHLPLGEEAVIDSLALPDDAAQRLQELGFVPGFRVSAAWNAPGGDPRVYRVDGAEIALRKETAACVLIRQRREGDVDAA